ncbi:ferredoxin [Actinocorallia populi]|uniref:ferredoxin n=1 Tax=Actinocorallia populi TaxID=2079200 RepID=UPI000D093DF7|nr:ferredoxin [Actinocorallia populi]
MSVRPDERLTDCPMRSLRCARCDGAVLVRKSSWEQTSIQWSEQAMADCPNLRTDRYETCPDLRMTIQQAALDGTLEVVAAE